MAASIRLTSSERFSPTKSACAAETKALANHKLSLNLAKRASGMAEIEDIFASCRLTISFCDIAGD